VQSDLVTAYANVFDRVAGDVTVNIAAFSPTIRIAAPAGTTHFKVVMGAAEIDFKAGTSVFESVETDILPYENSNTAAIDLSATVTENSTLPVFQVLGVEFYQEVNGQMYPLKNGAYNALAIIDIDTV